MFSDEEIKEISESTYMRPGDEIIRWCSLILRNVDIWSSLISESDLEAWPSWFFVVFAKQKFVEVCWLLFQYSWSVPGWQVWQEGLGTSFAAKLVSEWRECSCLPCVTCQLTHFNITFNFNFTIWLMSRYVHILKDYWRLQFCLCSRI